MQSQNKNTTNGWEGALTSSQPEQVKRSGRTSSLVFIVADDKPQDKRRAEVLAAVYLFILSPVWGKS